MRCFAASDREDVKSIDCSSKIPSDDGRVSSESSVFNDIRATSVRSIFDSLIKNSRSSVSIQYRVKIVNLLYKISLLQFASAICRLI